MLNRNLGVLGQWGELRQMVHQKAAEEVLVVQQLHVSVGHLGQWGNGRSEEGHSVDPKKTEGVLCVCVGVPLSPPKA